MQLASVLTPESDENLKLAAQCGVTDIVSRYPGFEPDALARQQERFARFGLRLSVIEGYLPIEQIKTGTDDGRELQAMKNLVQQMGQLQIPILCYNFMAGTDWVRTRVDLPERGGSRVTGFSLVDVERAILLGHDSAAIRSPLQPAVLSAGQLWSHLEKFLSEIVPVAEQVGVTLAMHPDDPPLPEFQGRARIMNSVEAFERLVDVVPSPHNAICFCQGSFATMGVDIPQAIRRLGPHIRYVHFRDVRGTPESFVETWHDNGPTDMVAAMQAYRDVGFDGPIRPDHVPQLAGEFDGEPGYTIQGRLFAWGYIRGLMQATDL
jgi:mannonate dehydratase